MKGEGVHAAGSTTSRRVTRGCHECQARYMSRSVTTTIDTCCDEKKGIYEEKCTRGGPQVRSPSATDSHKSQNNDDVIKEALNMACLNVISSKINFSSHEGLKRSAEELPFSNINLPAKLPGIINVVKYPKGTRNISVFATVEQWNQSELRRCTSSAVLYYTTRACRTNTTQT
eukprot:1392164-Amorphochlora_amoeboformis.AAC.1